jgi:predicted murein hydrolase (TIGR00659 family)
MREFLFSPLGAVTLTVGVYFAAGYVYRRVGWSILNPLLLTIGALIGLLLVFDVDYATYDEGGRLLSFFLGPAVVALGVPLAERWDEIRRQGRALAVSITAGAVVGVLAGAGTAALLGASADVILSVAPRSVTTPIAIGIAEKLGGLPPLTAAFVIASGVLGAIAGPAVLRLLGVRSATAFGLAMGASAHGIGTARAMEEGPTEGAASGLAIGLCGVATAVLAPLLVELLRVLGGFG